MGEVDGIDEDVRELFGAFEAAHAREDVDGYLEHFTEETVWVTSRGVCYRGRDALGAYLREVIPGGLTDGSVQYLVESVHPLGPSARLVVVAQTYLDASRRQRDARAAHTHTYVVVTAPATGRLRIAAGQNTVRS